MFLCSKNKKLHALSLQKADGQNGNKCNTRIVPAAHAFPVYAVYVGEKGLTGYTDRPDFHTSGSVCISPYLPLFRHRWEFITCNHIILLHGILPPFLVGMRGGRIITVIPGHEPQPTRTGFPLLGYCAD